jgi:hypothetical protein
VSGETGFSQFLIDALLKAVVERAIVEESSDAGQEDWCLSAMLSLLEAILSRYPALKV